MQATNGTAPDAVHPLLSNEPADSPPQCNTSTKSKSRRKNVCTILTVTYAVLATVAVAITLAFVRWPTSSTPTSENSKFQTTSQHRALKANYSMASVERLMNASVDPCHDFYHFACGNFGEVFPMPPADPFWATHEVVEERLRTTLDELIRNNSMPNWDAYRKLKQVYEGCARPDRFEAKRRAFTEIVRNMGGFSQNGSLNRSTVFGTNLPILFRYNLDSLFRLRFHSLTLPNSHKTGATNVSGVSPGERKISYTRHLVPVFEPQSLRSASHTAARKATARAKRANYLTRIVNNSLVDQGDTDISSLVYDVIDFEDWLNFVHYKALRGSKFPRVEYLSSQRLTLLCSLIDWEAIIQEVTSVASMPPESLSGVVIAMMHPGYLGSFCRFLANETADSSKLAAFQNYLVFRALMPFQLKEKPCVFVVGDVMPLAAGHLLEQVVLPQKTRNVVASLANVIKDEFLAELEDSFKMAPSTKGTLIEKVNQSKITIGYPEWAGDERSLNAYYSAFKTADNDVGNFVAAFHFELKQKLLTVVQGESAVRSKVFRSPIYVRAFYATLDKEILVSPGFIQPPYYDQGYPVVFQYGGIGSVIAHELFHTFNSAAFRRDAFLRWRQDCVKRYFSTFSDEKKKLRASVTINEDIADIGSLELAYRAYRNSKTPHSSVTLENGLTLTPDQQFFVAYAQNWCMSFTKEGMLWIISQDHHSPAVFRVLGAVSQVQAFGDAFNCPLRTPMNPRGKCPML